MRRCHGEIAAAYGTHPMGRSLSEIGGASPGPPTGADAGLPFESKGVQYNVERRDGRLFHQATWHGVDGGVLARIEAEVRYALGSGTRGITFLIEREAPLPVADRVVRAASGGGISPRATGSSAPTPTSSARSSPTACSATPTSSARSPDAESLRGRRSSRATPSVASAATARAQLHVNRTGPSDETDRTIVNPANLAPALRDSVCQQCHLQG